MDRKTMIGMASAALLVAQMGGNIPVHIGPSSPPRWSAANDTRKPPSGKNRAKVKAARKQRKATK
jgi:hypothetical protein